MIARQRRVSEWSSVVPIVAVCAGLTMGCDDSPTAPDEDMNGGSQVEVTLTPSGRGSIRSDGQVITTFAQAGDVALGGGGGEVARQAFLAFGLSSIPAGATIDSVRVDFGVGAGVATGTGNPFGVLGCLRAYPVTVFPLDAGDFFGGTLPAAVLSWCSLTELDASLVSDAVRTAVQDRVNAAASMFEVRLNFDAPTDNDGGSDLVALGAPTLMVTYMEP